MPAPARDARPPHRSANAAFWRLCLRETFLSPTEPLNPAEPARISRHRADVRRVAILPWRPIRSLRAS
eukprot:2861892-Alexandrium_andersonii.AAC.1